MDYINTHPFIFVTVGFGLVALIMAWFLFDIHIKWRRVFGRRVKTENDAAQGSLLRLLKAEARLDILEPRVNVLESIGRIAIQKVGFMRFNPFEHTGGDQSFAVALLDGENHGVVISSLYTREGVRVYAKEIKSGVSKHSLSEEEQEVLRQAISKNP